MSEQKKIIGTLVPLSALVSIKSTKKDQGTFETGIAFLDWLHKTKQNAWQILPLHQTQLEKGSTIKRVPSPYKGYGVGLDPKYLSTGAKATQPKSEEIKSFVQENRDWIADYALFCALSAHFGTDDWRDWGEDLRARKVEEIEKWRKNLREEINKEVIIQWQLHNSYEVLRGKANKMGILLIGDLPFYVSLQSPLAWVYQDIFHFENDGSMRYVSGIPDTSAAHFGRQVWGHPLYRWDIKHRKRTMIFWQMRLKYLSLLFDSIRFDHAKAFFDFGRMDLENITPEVYIKGPGHKVFEELMRFGKSCGLSIFAEDSGENLSELRASLNKLKTPGIKIFRFALNEKKKKLNKEYADLSNYPKNTVVYTTTHDTESLISYLSMLTVAQKKQLAAFSNTRYTENNYEFAVMLRSAIINSSANTIIIPIQDWLLIEDRINIPGTERDVDDPNWHFVLEIPVEKLPVPLL